MGARDLDNILDNIKKEFWVGETKTEIAIGKNAYTLKSLNHAEEIWKDKYISTSASLNFITCQKAPVLAVSIIAINGIPVEDLFVVGLDTTKDANSNLMKAFGYQEEDEKFLVAKKLLEFLKELPNEIINILYNKYSELQEARSKAINILLEVDQDKKK